MKSLDNIRLDIKIGYSIDVESVETVTNPLQVTVGDVLTYFPKKYSDDSIAIFNKKLLGVDVFIHFNLLVNLSVEKKVHIKSLYEYLLACDVFNAKGLVVHVGSNENREDGFDNSIKNLMCFKGNHKILLENMCGGHRMNVYDMLWLRDKVDVGLCFDTAHAWGAGIDVMGSISFIEKYVPQLVHLNNPDKAVALGSGRDLHSNSLFNGVFSNEEVFNIIDVCGKNNVSMVLENKFYIEDLEFIKNSLKMEVIA